MSTQVRSISQGENYATYLGLPLLGLNRFRFGEEDNFITSYFTENGKIVACVKDADLAGDYWLHPNYLTDIPHEQGVAILYSCPKEFEEDMSKLIGSQFSKLSEHAMSAIQEFSTLTFDFKQKDKKVVSSPLVHSLRYKKEGERELPLREQDILENVDSDITFNVHEYKEGKG